MTKRKIEPRLPKGMRDFLPSDMIKREYVFNIVRDVFHLYGFEPLQTPVLELRETLMGKYGEDAEKLIYHAQHPGGKEEVAMRYDLTVPLARVVAQYPNEIALPFRRYQLAPVWRAERPQRGRYREFYQCDADIAGAAGMDADAEIISLIVTALKRLGFTQFSVKINNRKLLTAIGQFAGVEGAPLAELYRSIDKFDKIGADGVRGELIQRGLADDVVARVMDLIIARTDAGSPLDYIEATMGAFPDGAAAIRELRDLETNLHWLGVPTANYEFDFTMVRGLGYYTGPIFETIITEPNLGSVTGGGRYDDLVGLFKGERVPTVGTSLGIERIIDLMDLLNLYPADIGGTVVQTLVTVFDATTRAESIKLAAALRAAGVRTEVFMLDRAIGKQIGYADKKRVPLVALLGADEVARGVVKFKRLADGYEETVERADAADTVKRLLGI
ncbi:MAG: histidine--tRNA ligase [Chloroflexota bacterium]|nr:histidine--tRNA ligase [Chloroflexota bacterium]